MRKVNILLVDDEPQITKMLKSQLRKQTKRFRILTCSSAERAREILRQESVGIAVVDRRMPECDGLELLRLIQSSYPAVRRILLTGDEFTADLGMAMQDGVFEAYISKPWDVHQLMETLGTIAREVAKSQQTSR